MNIKQIAMASMIGLASISPAKAQKPVQYAFQGGLTGVSNKGMSLCGGMDLILRNKKNLFDLYLGANFDGTSNSTVGGFYTDNYSWTKHLSSWVRGICFISKENVQATAEISPIRGNIDAGKFNFALNPAYAVYRDVISNKTTQGLNAIFQTTYSITPSDKLFLELKYSSIPTEKLKNISFGPLEDNLSYFLTYQKLF